MPSDANAIVFGYKTAEEIAQAISSAFNTKTDIGYVLSMTDMVHIYFNQSSDGQKRTLYAFLNGKYNLAYRSTYSGEATLLSFLAWGDSVDILQAVLNRFGGYLIMGGKTTLVRANSLTKSLAEKTNTTTQNMSQDIKLHLAI
jgi:hypothetical protein